MQYLYDDDFLIETFGTLSPTINERTEKFFALWCDWSENNGKLKNHAYVSQVRKTLVLLGYKEFVDYQINRGEIRFKTKEDLALAMLSGLGEYCV